MNHCKRSFTHYINFEKEILQAEVQEYSLMTFQDDAHKQSDGCDQTDGNGDQRPK